VSAGPPLRWIDGELSATGDAADRLTIHLDDMPIGEIVVYASYPGAWQRIHGYGDDEALWSFDIDIADPRHRERGYGSRAVRRTCEAVLESRPATRVVVDVRADNPRAIRA
jgi:RimJ/RimL family protein N-acetyltransferase